MVNILRLDISQNNFDSVFVYNSNLKILNLRYVTLFVSTFLILRDNNISNIALAGNIDLQILDLSFNALVSFPAILQDASAINLKQVCISPYSVTICNDSFSRLI
jgi:hypothetical protein